MFLFRTGGRAYCPLSLTSMKIPKTPKTLKTKQMAEAILAFRDGRKPNFGRKDGSVMTKPIVPCKPIPEREVLRECQRWLRRRCLCNRLNNGYVQSSPYNDRDNRGYQYGIKGAADLQCIYKGLHVDVECKSGKGGTLAYNQQQRRDDVERHGGVYLVVHGVEELEVLWRDKVELKTKTGELK